MQNVNRLHTRLWYRRFITYLPCRPNNYKTYQITNQSQVMKQIVWMTNFFFLGLSPSTPMILIKPLRK